MAYDYYVSRRVFWEFLMLSHWFSDVPIFYVCLICVLLSLHTKKKLDSMPFVYEQLNEPLMV